MLVGTQGRHLIFLECRAEYTGQFIVCHVVEQQPFTVYHQIHLIAESDAFRLESGTFHHPSFQLLQYSRFGSLRTVFRMQLRHDIGFARHKEFLKDGFGRRESQHCQRILRLYFFRQQFLQGRNAFRLFRLEIQFRLGSRKLTATVQDIVLHPHVGSMFQYLSVGLLHQSVHPSAVLVHMDIFVPLDTHHQFVLLNLRHTFLFQVEKEEHAQRKGGQGHAHTQFLVAEHPVDSLVIETLQPIVLPVVVETFRQPAPATDVHTEEQQIEYRKQHDTRDVRNQQPCRDRERLVHEDGSGNTAHEYQRNEHGNGGERRTEHRRDDFRRPCRTSPLQRIPSLPILRNVFRHDDGVVNHHPHRQNQTRKGNDIERHLEEIEQEERHDYRNRHAQTDDDRRTHIAQEEDCHDENQQEADGKIVLQVRDGVVQ